MAALALVAGGVALAGHLAKGPSPSNDSPSSIMLDISGVEAADCQIRTMDGSAAQWGDWMPATQPLAPSVESVQLYCERAQPLAARVPPGSETLSLEPKEGHFLRGVLRRVDSGEPLGGVRIELRSPDWVDWPGWQVLSDADGHFEVADLPPPPFELDVEHPGFEAQRLWLSALPDGDLTIDLAPVGVLDIQLAGSKSGSISWVSGLELWPARETHAPAAAASVRVASLPAGQVRAWARSDGKVAGPSDPLEIVPGQVSQVRLEFRDAPHVTGTVHAAQGRPIGGASLQVLPPDAGLPPQQLITAASGQFVSAALFEVPARIWVRAEGYVDQVVEGMPGEPVRVVLRPTLQLEGVVSDEDGNPLAGVEVWATGPEGESVTSSWAALLDPSAGELGVTRGPVPAVPIAMAGASSGHGSATRTDARGHFTLTGITAEHVRIHAAAEGYAPSNLERTASQPSRDLKVVLRRGGTLHGMVRDARDFEVPGIDVRLTESGGLSQRWSSTDERGEFHFEGLRGPIEVTAFEHGDDVDQCRLELQRGDVVECALHVGQPRGSVRVTVRETTGEAIHGARLLLRSAEGDGTPRTRQRLTDPSGVAVFGALPLQPHTLRVQAAGFVAHEELEVDPETETAVELDLVRAGEVSGVVIDSLGAPIAGARVRERSAQLSVVTSEDGDFVMDGLPPGDASLSAHLGQLQSPLVHTRVRARERVAGLRLSLDGRAPPPGEREEIVKEETADAEETDADDLEQEDEGSSEDVLLPSVVRPLQLAQQGADSVVTSVQPGSDAARAGFSTGDVVTHVDGEQVFTVAQARGMLRDPAGELARVQLQRGKKRLTVRFRRPALR